MAAKSPLDRKPIASTNPAGPIPQTYHKIGFLNGLIIGLALAGGAWLIDALRLSRIPVPLQFPSLLLGSLLLIILCTLTGWLTSRWQSSLAVLLAWFTTAILAALIIGYQPYLGRTITIWLADRRFWGLSIFPPPTGLTPGLVIFTGFFVIILLTFLALLQTYRLEGIHRELTPRGRLLPLAWLLLLIPTPFLFGAGYITNDINGDTSAYAIQLVHQAIQVGRTYEGDLFALGLADGVNYSAIRGVREQMSATYTLAVGGIDPDSASTFIIAYFDNGTWVSCRVINDQLSFCADASPPYTSGFAGIIAGDPPPADCVNCRPLVDEQWTAWLQARQPQLGQPVQTIRLAQWGSYVLMQAANSAGTYAINCWFNNFNPANLESCIEVTPNQVP